MEPGACRQADRHDQSPYQRRVAVNIVSGWFRGEFHAIGEPWFDHDERYRRSEEFIRALRGIWTEDNFTFRGDFYRFNNYSLKPKPIDPQPEIFQGGSSRAARDMAARVSDWYFTNGNTPEEIAKQVDDIRSKAKENNHSVKVGVNAFAIVRETEEEAKAVLAEIIEKANPEAVNAFGHEVKNAASLPPKARGNWQSPVSRTSSNTMMASAPISSGRRGRWPSAS